MVLLETLSFTTLELALLGTLAALTISMLVAMHKIRRLDERVAKLQRTTQKEIKMVSQGAIGMGRRVASLEREHKTSPTAARFSARSSAAEQRHAAATRTASKPSPKLSTQAEKALSEWVSEHTLV